MKNNCSIQFSRIQNLLWIASKKIPRTMKLFILFFACSLGLTYASETYAQKASVNLEMQDKTVKDVLKEIERQSGFGFFYNNSQINLNRRVSLNTRNSDIFKVLNQIFEGTNVGFYVLDKKIVLTTNAEKEVAQQASSFKMTGKVTDTAGEPIIGATVIEKGTPNGTVTDLDGNFEFKASKKNFILEVSYIGYTKVALEAKVGTPVKVTLKEDTKTLDEVVVVGYGTVKRSDLTGSVSSLNSDNLTVASQTNAVDALQGRISGVNITRNAARPGGSYNITVRGLSSINNSNTPLWVIDGIPSSSDARDLNPADIEKIDVLKDASATAIYGSRGANGVVIVTTKRGKEGHFSINYDGYYGVRVASNLPDMMNGDEYVKFRTQLFKTQGKSTDRSNAEFFTTDEWNRIDNKDYTDWIDLVLRTGQQYSNTITASGGDEKGTFSVGIGQLHEEGTVRDQDFNRYNMHLNVNRKIQNAWELGGSMYFTYSKQNEGSYEALRSAYRLPQVASPYDENGNLVYHAYRNDNVSNPLLESSKDGEHRENKRYRVFGNIYLQFIPIKGLTLKSQFAPQMLYTRAGTYIGVNAKNSNGKLASTTANYNQSLYWGYVWDNQISYDKSIDKHKFNVSLVHSMQMEQWEYSNQAAKNLPFNSEWYNLDAASLSDVTESSTDFQKRTLMSVLGRLQYSYNDRYLFTASGRYDGSSRLSEGNKWAFFPSAAIAWRLSEENFMKNFKELSNLKLRLSYGVTGNDAVSIYGTQSGVSSLYYDYGGSVVSAYYKSGLANKNLSWEKTYEINLGLDFGFFNNRINGSVDVYQRDAKDLIMKRNLPTTSGWSSVWDNVGWVKNRGVEVALNTTNIQNKNFAWQTNINFSANHNEIVELYGAKNDDVSNKWFIGQPVDVNYDYVFDGIWQTNEASEAAKYGQTPGQVKVKDLDNNGIINASDKQILGHRSPSWIGSITNTFTYMDFDFSFFIYTQQGAQIQDAFMSTFMTYEGNYKQVNVNYWTEDNPSNSYPKPGNKGKYYDAMRYQKVSFVRVGSITFGYNLPKSFLKKLNVKNLRLYCTTNNPFTFSSYKGFDPEWASQNTWGTATGYTTYLFGAKLEF